MKNNPEYAAAERRMADSPHKRGLTQKESTMRAKDELQHLVEAYAQVNEARFWGDKEGVARHNKELRDSGARSFEHPGGHGTTGHFTDEQVEKLEQDGYKEREIKDIEDQEWPAEWSTVDALADILAELANTWQEGEYGDTDKESLKDYINEFIDKEIDDRKIDDGAPLPDHPAGNAWPLGRAAAIKKAHGLFYK